MDFHLEARYLVRFTARALHNVALEDAFYEHYLIRNTKALKSKMVDKSDFLYG